MAFDDYLNFNVPTDYGYGLSDVPSFTSDFGSSAMDFLSGFVPSDSGWDPANVFAYNQPQEGLDYMFRGDPAMNAWEAPQSGGGGFMDSLYGAEKWMKDHSTLASMGMGGLGLVQSIYANRQKEKARKAAEAQMQARLAAQLAAKQHQDRPLTLGTFSRGPASFSPAGPSRFGVEHNYFPGGNSLGAMPAATGGLASLSRVKSNVVPGASGGQADDVPAMLSDGEYVVDADVVSALGDGSNEAGAKKLDQMRKAVRTHKRSAPASSIPPKAKSPMQYLKKGAK